jgi:hypothetical protein
MSFDIVPTHLAVQAMRDNGYKNTAYALAELMDNSIQAGATLVELLCLEEKSFVHQRHRKQVKKIAVLDNGSGMHQDVLRMALQFGNGTRLDLSMHTGMGKFGMGLPSSSISQCTHVEVWTWQRGIEGAIWTYLDINDIRERSLNEVPEPINRPVPAEWLQMTSSLGQSGTLVVWSQLDRCRWNSARALVENSESLIGRMYRKFLNNRTLQIRFAWMEIDAPDTLDFRFAKPNDPMYLMKNTTCPAPWDVEPMFAIWGNEHEIMVSHPILERRFPVTIRYSVAKRDARLSQAAGNLPHGKHAAKNLGVSIVRAGRELDLEQSFVNPSDVTERWWGVEIEFPPILDEVFGVTNNKQTARYLSEAAKMDLEELTDKNTVPISQIATHLMEDSDHRGPLVELVYTIQRELKKVRKHLDAQTAGIRGRSDHSDGLPIPPKISATEQRAKQVVEERRTAGYVGNSDRDVALPPDEKKERIREDLIAIGVLKEEAESRAEEAVTFNLPVIFAHAPLDTSAFFSLKSVSGTMTITLNTDHPAYYKLLEVLEEDVKSTDVSELRERLIHAGEGLRLLLAAWARYEDELLKDDFRDTVREVRTQWGRMARAFMQDG